MALPSQDRGDLLSSTEFPSLPNARHFVARHLLMPLILLVVFSPHSSTHAGVHAGPSTCFMEFDSTASKQGNFSSPGYPDNYPENIECYYTFKGQESETLRITFYEFELEEPFQKGCLNDFVDISTISVSNVKQLVGRFCGTYVPIPLHTMKPRMEIIFKANHALSAKGFFGHYEFTDESFVPPPPSSNVTNCGGTLTGVGGILVSPNYPDSFPKDVDCAWLIRVDYEKHIYIRVLELQLKGSIANCGEAELVIYDGYSSIDVNPVLLKRYCGDLKYYKNTEEKTQLSRRNRIVVRLRTTVASPQKHEGEIIGFKLVWTAVTFANQCEQFTCGKSQYCLNTESGTCNTSLTKNYCIDRSLQCDGVPNCSGEDSSDEDKCRLPLLAGCGAAGGALALIILISLTCVKKDRPSKMEHELDLTNMERSLSMASRRYSMAMGLGMGGALGPMIDPPGGACVLHNNIGMSPYDDVLPPKMAHFAPESSFGRRHLTDV
ncbi:cubilin [Galendromus occidentalis]|uniref:Cubilin n=1 Tax=Galendromus occidentalis TaxID=34638 RepID=A0AAJ6QP11_9ACAR|nr:cubilin [Galendromus occidentalis]